MASQRKCRVPSAPSWWSESTDAIRDLLVGAALLEGAVPVAWVASWGMEDAEIDRLLESSVLLESADGFTVPDAKVGPQIVAVASWSKRKRVHLLLAQACTDPPARFETAGLHFERAGKNAEAAHAYLSATEEHCRNHRYAAARRCFFPGLRLLPANLSDEVVIRALQTLGRCAARAPETADAARDLVALGRDEEAAEALVAVVGTLAFAGQTNLAREAAEAAVHAANRVGSPSLESRARMWRGLTLGMLGESKAGQAGLERTSDLVVANNLTGNAAEAQHLLGTVREYASRYVDEEAAFTRAARYCRKHGGTLTEGIFPRTPFTGRASRRRAIGSETSVTKSRTRRRSPTIGPSTSSSPSTRSTIKSARTSSSPISPAPSGVTVST